MIKVCHPQTVSGSNGRVKNQWLSFTLGSGETPERWALLDVV